MLLNVRTITKDDLLETVSELAAMNYRLVSITGTDTGEGFDLLYHFDKTMNLINLRFAIAYSEEVPSITPFYFCAIVPENELKDFLGVKISNLPIDYRQLFILSKRTPIQTPLLRKTADGNGVLPE